MGRGKRASVTARMTLSRLQQKSCRYQQIFLIHKCVVCLLRAQLSFAAEFLTQRCEAQLLLTSVGLWRVQELTRRSPNSPPSLSLSSESEARMFACFVRVAVPNR